MVDSKFDLVNSRHNACYEYEWNRRAELCRPNTGIS